MSILTWLLKEGDLVVVEHPPSGKQKTVRIIDGPNAKGSLIWIQFKYGINSYCAYFCEQYQTWYCGWILGKK